MKNKIRWLTTAMLIVMLLCQSCFAAITTNMEISQVIQDDDGVSMYANLMDDQGNSTGESFTVDKFSGIVDGNEIPADSAINFNSTGEGIYYVVCVDISKSLNSEDMSNIVNGLDKFISYLNSADFMSVYAFGSEVKPLVIESDNKEELLSAVSTLKCTDMNTQLYGVINESLSLARVRPDAMPERAAVIVLTDGTDDPSAGKGDLYTYENTLKIVEESGVPVYTIAVEKKNQQLDNLEAFAQASGGDLIRSKTSGIPDALNGLRMQIRNASLVHIPLVNTDGKTGLSEHAIGLALNLGDRKIVAGNPHTMDIDWHALPVPVQETATPVPTPTATPEVTATPEPVEAAAEPKTEEVLAVKEAETAEAAPTIPPETGVLDRIQEMGDYVWFIFAGAFILLALIILLIILLSGKRKKKKAQQMSEWGNDNAFNSAWETNSAYDFVTPDNAEQDFGSAGSAATERIGQQAQQADYAAPTERIGQQAQQAYAAPTERIGQQAQQAYAAPTERIGQQAQQAYAAPTERIGQQAYAAPTERIGVQSTPAVSMPDLTASTGTVRLAPQETGIKILVEERRRSAGVDHTRFVYLEKVLVFGHNFDCDYIIQDEAASGEHFKITREVDGLYITDLKSTNGTLLNGKPLYSATALRSEDVIKAGNTTLRIRFEI